MDSNGNLFWVFNHQVLWGIQWDARPAQMMITGLVFEPPPLTSTSQIVDDHPKAERKQTSTSNQPLGCFTFIGWRYACLVPWDESSGNPDVHPWKLAWTHKKRGTPSFWRESYIGHVPSKHHGRSCPNNTPRLRTVFYACQKTWSTRGDSDSGFQDLGF